MNKEEVLVKSGKEYFSSGNDEFNKSRYNSALVLYFKALISFSDLYVFQKTGNTPSSHNNRFKVTKEKFPEVYDLLDKDFPFCQEPYHLTYGVFRFLSTSKIELTFSQTKVRSLCKTIFSVSEFLYSDYRQGACRGN